MKPVSLSPHHARRAFAVAAVAVLVPLAWLGSVDTLAKEYVEAGLKRALVTFAAARAANAVISVIQETTISVAPAGVGVTSSPGQALDPVNDLVEQFSTLMLAASVSLGAQALLMSVASLAAVSAAVTVALLAWGWFAWRGGGPAWLPRLVVLVLFVRFAVPLAALASEAAFRATLAEPYAEAQRQVDNTGQVLLGMSVDPAPAAREEGLIDRARRFLSDERQSIAARVQQLRDRAEELIRHLITLAAVFALQTLVLPLAFLWIALRLFGATMRWRP